MNIAETINAAINVIKERGHTKGVRQDGSGRVCALGAFDVLWQEQRTSRTERLNAIHAVALQITPDQLTEDDPYNFFRAEEIRRIRRTMEDASQLPYQDKHDMVVVAGFNNTHTMEELIEVFEKAALNSGITVE